MHKWVMIELLKRDADGYLPGSRREVLSGAADFYVRRGLAKLVTEKKKRVNKKTSGTGSNPGVAAGDQGVSASQ